MSTSREVLTIGELVDDEPTVLREWSFAAGPGAETSARQLVAAAVAAEYPEKSGLREDISLVTSELVTNAVRVASGPVVVRVTADAASVTVSVTDDGPGWPQLRRPGVDDPTGRGLLLVDAVSQDWGVVQGDGVGKTVWARCVPRPR